MPVPYNLDLTDGRAVELGKIKIGAGGKILDDGSYKKGTVKLEHFQITTLERIAEKLFKKDDEVHKILGNDKPRELTILLLHEDPAHNFMVRREFWIGASYCACTGNGQDAENPGQAEWVEQDGSINENWTECRGKDCPWATGDAWKRREASGGKVIKSKPRCNLTGILQCQLWLAPRIGGVYTFRTTGYYTIKAIQTALAELYNLTGGNIQFLPLLLCFNNKVVGKGQSRHKIPFVTLEFRGTYAQLFEGAGKAAALIADNRQKLRQLAATRRLEIEAGEIQEDITAEQITDEFHPGLTAEPEAPWEELAHLNREAIIREYLPDLEAKGLDLPHAMVEWGRVKTELELRGLICKHLGKEEPEDAEIVDHDASFADGENDAKVEADKEHIPSSEPSGSPSADTVDKGEPTGPNSAPPEIPAPPATPDKVGNLGPLGPPVEGMDDLHLLPDE
jgi:hypothetical protein